DAELGSVTVIVNQGRLSGASLEHPHSQVFATTVRPDLVDAELVRLAQPDCVACAVVNKERGGERVVADGDGRGPPSPCAPSRPSEVLLLPDQHLPRFQDGGPGDPAVAGALRGLLAR